MVRALVERRDAGEFEYWAIAPFILQEAPDRAAARETMTAGFVPRIAAGIGDDSGAQVRSRLVVTLMLGLASGLRTFEIVTPDVIDSGVSFSFSRGVLLCRATLSDPTRIGAR